jgi:hypothetical protein
MALPISTRNGALTLIVEAGLRGELHMRLMQVRSRRSFFAAILACTRFG